MSDKQDKIIQLGFEDTILLKDYDFETALIGVTTDGRAVYSYNLMIDYLVSLHSFTVEDAVEWIDTNTLRALSYMGTQAPIIMFSLEE